MSHTLISAAGIVVAAVVAGDVIAQSTPNVPMPEVIVETHRAVSTQIGTTSSGIPIHDVSMGYTVTAEGLDLSTPAGSRAMEARVSQAATAACQELARRWPNSSTTDTQCIRQATDRAMAQVRQLENEAVKARR